MKKILESTDNITKIDLVNTSGSRAFKEITPDQIIPIRGAAAVEETDDDGKVTKIAYIFAEGGEVYGGNSANGRELVSSICDLFADDPALVGHLGLKVNAGVSKSGQTYLTFNVQQI